MIHDYFKRKYTEWDIVEFLEQCDLDTFGKKIECYLVSLEKIADLGDGRRSLKAKELLDNYRKASISVKKE